MHSMIIILRHCEKPGLLMRNKKLEKKVNAVFSQKKFLRVFHLNPSITGILIFVRVGLVSHGTSDFSQCTHFRMKVVSDNTDSSVFQFFLNELISNKIPYRRLLLIGTHIRVRRSERTPNFSKAQLTCSMVHRQRFVLLFISMIFFSLQLLTPS